jgi:hypothetical protein
MGFAIRSSREQEGDEHGGVYITATFLPSPVERIVSLANIYASIL